LQDSELKSWLAVPTSYPVDSRKAFCEVGNTAFIAKHFELT